MTTGNREFSTSSIQEIKLKPTHIPYIGGVCCPIQTSSISTRFN